MIKEIVVHLSSDNVDLKMQCSSCIFKCASDKIARDIVREAGGLESLVAIIKDKSIRDNKALLAAGTGAIWKCAASASNVKRLDQLKIMHILVQLLSDENDDVLTNAAGAISECVKFQNNRDILRQNGGLALMIVRTILKHLTYATIYIILMN